ncbi:MAG: type IV pilus modification PilV family protein [Gammaproteobacteria bacterium]
MNNERGFSLLEILVAFAVLALSLGILLRIFSGGVNNAIVADGYTSAIQIAESLLARTGVETPLEQGQASGVMDETYYWRISVSPYEIVETPLESSPQAVSLMLVQVEVNWQEGQGEPRQVELTTLKLINNVP